MVTSASGIDALAARYRGEVQLGTAPAVLLVDFTGEFVHAQEMRPELPCNPEAATARARELVRTARDLSVPVVWTRNTVETPHGRESWTWTHGPDRRPHPEAGEIVGFDVAGDDFVVNKTKPSAFFGTPLLSFLIARRIDTLLIAGGTTSGCVRATVVDAFSYSYRTGLLADACFDRDEESHRVTVKDVGAKYCRVTTVDGAVAYLASLSGEAAR